MSLGRRRVLVGRRDLGTSELFRKLIVLQRWPGIPGTEHITHVMTGPVGRISAIP
jgi:hypothetical protein